jgi:hypothetical protein
MKSNAHRMGMTVGALVALSGVALSGLALAGCGGSEEPPAETPQTSSAPADTTQQAAAPADEDASAMDAIAGTPERLTDPMDQIPGGASVAGLTWETPSAWIVVPTTPGGMRAAQYTAPSGSGLAPAEVVVFYFGPDGQGGDVSSNLARWSSQVLDDAGAPTQPAVTTFQNGPLDVTTALYEGAYMSGMPGQERTPQRGWALLAAIVEGGPEGNLFLRMTGPAPVVDDHREAFEVMIRTIQPIDTSENESAGEGESAG